MSKIFNELKSLRKLVYRRLYMSQKKETELVDKFHQFYYDSQLFGDTWENTKWMGVPTRKCPLDFWIYQEILFELKPDVIVECGTSRGGSALFLAHMCDLIGKGKVLSIDIETREDLPVHKRVKYLLGSSTSPEIFDQVKSSIKTGDVVLVIRDSDHRYAHVIKELELYSKIVSPGSYLIVEDSNLNGHPVAPDFGPGPQEALQEFLLKNTHFEIDKAREKFYLSFNPNGYLRKKL